MILFALRYVYPTILAIGRSALSLVFGCLEGWYCVIDYRVMRQNRGLRGFEWYEVVYVPTATQVEVRDLRYGAGAIRGSVIGSTGDLHHCELRFDGRRMCDCRGYYFRDSCSHLEALAQEVPAAATRDQLLSALDQDSPTMTLQPDELTIGTSLKPFNEMMSPTDEENHPLAGIPVKTGVGISGRPEAGKTTLTFQLMHEVLRQRGEGSNALLFDTEGSIHTYYGWQEAFQNRFGLDTEIVPVEPRISSGQVQGFNMERKPEADHQIFLLDVRDLPKILTIHGRPAEISTEDGKMKLEPNGDHPSDIRDTAIGQFVFQNDIEAITYDSVTNPLEQFTNRQQDRPTRAKATAWWMLQAQSLAETKEMVQFYITHLSKNPASPYDRPDIIGGKNVKHQIKYSIYLREGSDNERHMQLFRHPAKEPWTDQWDMKLETGKGMVPIED